MCSFFLVPGTMLCFELNARMKSITHWHSSCCWAVLTLNHRLLSFPYSACAGAQESRTQHSQDRGPETVKGTFLTQSILLATHTGRIVWGVRDGLRIGQQVMSSCSSWCLFTIATFLLQFVLLLLVFYCFLGPFCCFSYYYC